MIATDENLEASLRNRSFLSGAWKIANLHLGSVGAELLGKEAQLIVALPAVNEVHAPS